MTIYEQEPPSWQLPRPARRSGVRCGDWMHLNCGDTVFAVDDPRHLGRVEAIHNSAIVLVRWHDNGWLEEIALENLCQTKEEN